MNCQNKKKTDESQLVLFNLTNFPAIGNVQLSDLGFYDIKYIPLETTEESMIQHINNLIFGKDYFLIHFFTKIYMFRSDGSFAGKIGTEGRGPNEFTVVHDIDIENESQNIYLADGWQEKFFVYSESGDYIRSFRTPIYSAIDFECTVNGILCYNMNQFSDVQYSYNLIDTNGSIIKNYSNKYQWNKIQQNTAIFNENLFYKFNNKLYKKEVYSDTVFVFENLEFHPHFVIKHGEKLLTTTARSAQEPSFLFENYINQSNLFEFGDYVYYEFMYGFKVGANNILRGLIGSKGNDFQVLINAEKGIINDLDGGPNIWPKKNKDDNTIISWIDAIQLKKHVASDAFKNSTPRYPEKKKELEKLAAGLKETDNPVLVLVRLKK